MSGVVTYSRYGNKINRYFRQKSIKIPVVITKNMFVANANSL